MSEQKPPEILDKIVDLVLAYRPKIKSKLSKSRGKSRPKPTKKNKKTAQQ